MRYVDSDLARLGLEVGDVVRFRRHGAGRWLQATVKKRERDGSVGLIDERGLLRSIAPDALEVRRSGARGGRVWKQLSEVAAQDEQLPLI